MTRKIKGSTKGERRAAQRANRRGNPQLPGDSVEVARPRSRGDRRPVQPQTEAQKRYINAIENFPLTFCKGPAGTGKTFVAAAIAAEMFDAKEIRKIIITRPAVGAEEEYGFFPGDLDEKSEPWARPVLAILEERLGTGAVEYMLKSKQIDVAPLGMLRGHTFKDAFIIFDEAQNATPNQMKLFLTRLGENVTCVIDGDPKDQNDLRDGRGRKLKSGLDDAWRVMGGHESVGFVEFTNDDIVRSGLCRDIIIRYQQDAENDNEREGAVGQAELEWFLTNGSR